MNAHMSPHLEAGGCTHAQESKAKDVTIYFDGLNERCRSHCSKRQEISWGCPYQDALELGLAGFEVITANEYIVLDRKFNEAGHKRVLGCSIDEWHAFQHTSCPIQAGWRHLQPDHRAVSSSAM